MIHSHFRTSLICGAGVAATIALAVDVHAAITVTRIAYTGQTVTHNSVDVILATLNAPFTNSLGQPGFTGGASPGGNFVWYDTGIVWQNADDTKNILTGTEGTMGISDTGGFNYSPSFNGNDSVYTHNGKLLADGDAHPALPGLFSTFNSRPTMLPDGTAYWIGGYTDTSGGSTQGRAFLKCTDTSDPNTITKILQTGDLIDGLAIGTTGLGFAYDVSDSGNNYIIASLVGGSTATDDRVLVNGVTVAQAGSPTGAGDNWGPTSSFADMSINNSGNYIHSGDTDSATSADEVMVYNGSIVLREGDTLGGLTLGGAVNGASLNNFNRFVAIWSTTSPTGEALFYGRACNASAAQLVLAVGMQVDYDGDRIPDATIMDFEASGTISPGLSLSDHNYVYAEVELRDTGATTNYEAIIRIPLPQLVDCPADVNGDCQVNVTDLLAVIGAWGATDFTFADINGDGEVNVTDLLAVIGAWGTCSPPL